ncbi:MAG: phosphoadenosine phosphosulfate reductase domain-containing protein [Thermoplasmatota archaeon]
MAQVRLGRMTLHWCPACNLPLLERRPCGLCGSDPSPVALTPPGDARPAFDFDVSMIRERAEEQFGGGAGRKLLPDGRVVLLNRIPDIDRTDEVVSDGAVLGNFTYLPGRGFQLQLRMAGAERLSAPERGWVVADEGAIPSILRSSNLLGPGVVDASPGIRPGDEVLVLSSLPDRGVVAVGSARMTSEEMSSGARGTAVKVRSRLEIQATEGAGASPRAKRAPSESGRPVGSRGWDEVVEANRGTLERERRRAVAFIRDRAASLGVPVAVSYSGGKDSLATLLLVLEAGLRPRVVFVDTGLEFPETVENARSVCSALGLELVTESAGDSFWRNLPRFGPPARDARWCCKCCKLGPVTRLISREFPQGVLSFIGQRRYESEARALKGPVWRNPWVPGQTGASPIQEWPALQLWLYIFSKVGAPAAWEGGSSAGSGGPGPAPAVVDWGDRAGRAPEGLTWNPWYERGLERIGCFLCPATNLADLELVRGSFPGFKRWEEALSALPESWRLYGLWRWRHHPRGIKIYLTQRGLKSEAYPRLPPGLELVLEGGEVGEGGLWSRRGRFTRPLDTDLLSTCLLPLGRVREEAGRVLVGDWAEVCPDGSVVLRAQSREGLGRRAELLREAVLRAEECAGCGICAGRCGERALTIVEGRAVIDAGRCTSCGACLRGPCPVTAYGPAGQTGL